MLFSAATGDLKKKLNEIKETHKIQSQYIQERAVLSVQLMTDKNLDNTELHTVSKWRLFIAG